LKYCKIKIRFFHFYLLGGIFAIKILTATKEFFRCSIYIWVSHPRYIFYHKSKDNLYWG